MAASESFSIFIFNNHDISEKNIKYLYPRNMFNNKYQETENIQKQSLRTILKVSFLKLFKYSREIYMVEIVSTKNNYCYSFSKTALNTICLPSNWKF